MAPAARGVGALVGRDAELAALREGFGNAVAARRPHAVLVTGEAGIGKSRLIAEFLRLVDGRTVLLQGRCPPAGMGSTHWPLAEALRATAGISLGQSSAGAARTLTAHVRSLPPDRLDETRLDLLHALATTAGIALPNNPLDITEPRSVEVAIRVAWPRYLSARASDGATILVIEDLHWADVQLVRILEAIHEQATGPILLALTARPAYLERETGAARKRWLHLPLRRLGEAASVALLLQMTGAKLAPSLARDVTRNAEGNPLFLEEAARHLIDVRGHEPTGAREAREATWGTTVPTTIRSLLTARIQALPPAEMKAVEAASIVGKTFWDGAVAAALGVRSARAELGSLEARGLIVRRPASSISGQQEFQFKHVLIREAAYDGLHPGRRARSHLAVGTWLESLARERLVEVDEFVAEHYRRALEDGDRAGTWTDHPEEREQLRLRAFTRLVSAGAAARQRFAIDHAVEQHGHAVGLAVTPSERAESHEELGEDHETALRGPESLDAYLAGLEAARDPSVDPDRRAGICMKAARTLVMRWGAFPQRPAAGLMDELIDEGLEVVRDPATRCWLLALNGGVRMRWEEFGVPDPVPHAERMRRTREAIETAPALGLANVAGFGTRILGQLEFSEGLTARAAATFRSIDRVIDQMDSRFQRALTSSYVFLSRADVEGAYGEALPIARRVLDLGRELSPHEHMHGTFMLLWALHHLGRWSELETVLDEHLVAMTGEEDIVCPFVRSGPLTAALTHAFLGDRQRAGAITSRLKLTWEEPGLPEALMSRVATASGDPATGLDLAERVLATGRAPSIEENAWEHVARVEALTALGDWPALHAAVGESRRWEKALAPLGPVLDRADAQVALTEQRTEAAVALLRGAVERFGRMGMRYEVARTKAVLAQALPDATDLLLEAMDAAEPLFETSPAAGGGPASGIDLLSTREREVLGLVARGMTNDAIAAALVLSARTVEHHLSNIYGKLGIEGKAARAAASALAARVGLTESAEDAASRG